MEMIRCSLIFHKARVGELSNPAVTVRDGIFDNPALFVTPPIAQPVYQSLVDTYINTYAAYSVGGSAQQGAYRTASIALEQGMDTMADYVNEIADGDANIITTAGFIATKGSGGLAPEPEQLQDIELARGSTGQILAECEKQDYASVYICILSENAPLPPDFSLSDSGQMTMNPNYTPGPNAFRGIIDFGKSRKKKFTGLMPGNTYYVVFFVINTRGVSAMSTPVSIICY